MTVILNAIKKLRNHNGLSHIKMRQSIFIRNLFRVLSLLGYQEQHNQCGYADGHAYLCQDL